METIQAALEMACAQYELQAAVRVVIEAAPLKLHIRVLQLVFQCRCRPSMIRLHSQVPTLRKQAEEEIQRFRYLPKPITVCQYILEHSGSLGARFQASTSPPMSRSSHACRW